MNHRRILRRPTIYLVTILITSFSPTTAFISNARIKTIHNHRYRRRHLQAIESTLQNAVLSDYAPAAASLFNNMKLPAAVVTAGMISLGFATRFPELPRDSLEKVYPQELRAKCAKLERLHIVLGLISVTSMLIVVLWAAVEVNQLTERHYDLTYSVWDLIHRDCDLAWSAVNSHYMLGIIGFTGMLWLRAYVMLLASNASRSLMNAASTGTAAALCLLISIVNRGVESGGGNSEDRYGSTILDLFWHYATLLFQAATDEFSPGPLQLSAIVLEIISLCFMFQILLTESETSFEQQQLEEDSCPIDSYDILNDEEEIKKMSKGEVEKLKTCIVLEEEERMRINGYGAEERKDVSGDCSSAVS